MDDFSRLEERSIHELEEQLRPAAEPETPRTKDAGKAAEPPLPTEPPPALTDASRRAQKQFGFAYWQNGWRKQAGDTSRDTLVLETGRYGFSLDMADFRNARFGELNDDVDYASALAGGSQRLAELKPIKLNFDVKVDGQVYRAIRCRAGIDTDVKHLRWARMWESGRLMQRFELLELVLEDAKGNRLECNARLELVGWPDSLTLTGTITPGVLYADGPHPGANGTGLCVVKRSHSVPHKEGMDHAAFSLEAWINVPSAVATENKGYLLGKNGSKASKSHFGFMLDEGRVSAVMNVAGGREGEHQIGATRDAFHLDNWNHMVLTYDGKDMVYYVNGVAMGRRAINLPRERGTGPLNIGHGLYGATPALRGLYDQIMIWNRALPAEEVEAHALDARKLESKRGLTYMELFQTRRKLEEHVPQWKNVAMRLQLKNDDHAWEVHDKVPTTWDAGDERSLTLTCNLREQQMPAPGLTVQVDVPGHSKQLVPFDSEKDCYLAEVKHIRRNWRTGYTDIRNYDEIPFTVNNPGGPIDVPVQIYLRDVANITGLCPILCDASGKPTGIPVQLSKNWHYQPLGAYLRSSMVIPVPQGESHYMLRIPYGFYGTVPSASHAQLSLVGYGGNGRWEQLAIGCWGETMCFDMDMSCVDNIVTDVRCLMVRNGARGNAWGWTDAGWGGDWLRAYDTKRQVHMPREWKTSYVAHGPCLTDVRYSGQYGASGAVDVGATLRTVRTDDYARTFQTLRYRVNEPVDLKGGWLFKMGKTGQYHTPRVAYGNRAGVIGDKKAPATLKNGQVWLAPFELKGEGPWWVGFPEASSREERRHKGAGTRALIIRKYEAILDGVVHTNPTLQISAYVVHGKEPSLDVLLTPPRGVTRLQAGAQVDLDVEWITLPSALEDYYGPNTAFQDVLKAHPNGWEPIHREAEGNDLLVRVNGGELLESYPVIVKATGPKVVVDIAGGVGMVPLRVEGLHAATGYTLYRKLNGKLLKFDQAVHGNDFWQSDYHAASNSWSRSYNLPLDGVAESTWVLVRE